MADRKLINDNFILAVSKYSKLNIPETKDSQYIVTGVLDIIDEKGVFWDSYNVQINIPANYPKELPTIIETSEKIIRSNEWHINDDTTCCLGTPAKVHMLLSGDNSLLNWLDKVVIPFFANHILKSKTDKYAAGECSHGIAGIIEDYQELFKINSIQGIVARLGYMTGLLALGRNEKCFCGSEKKYKVCYLQNVLDHNYQIPDHVLKNDLATLIKIIRQPKRRRNQFNS
jgi:hypothetical protein